MRNSLYNALDGERLRQDIIENAEYGKVESDTGHGRTVLPGTKENRKARDRFLDQLNKAGLETTVDPVGTIVGQYCPQSADSQKAPVAAGSHLDSVPRGGIFDGPLGVYGALEAVRAIDDADLEIARPIEVVSFTEEEGHRFTDGLLGSSVAAGDSDVEELLSTVDDDGTTLREALESIGYHGEAVVDASEWDAWLELHVEQSEQLTANDADVGVVTSIAGTTRCRVEIEGEANHSGTTQMSQRTDALVAASKLTVSLERVASELSREDGGETVATVGQLITEPGAVNVVPGRVTMRLDIRSTAYKSIERILTHTRNEISRLEADQGVEITLECPYDIKPVPMTERCRQALLTAAEETGATALALYSGAGHDTMKIATQTDAGLLFVPSEDGVSHHPDEWTDWDDCLRGVEVLTGALAQLSSS